MGTLTIRIDERLESDLDELSRRTGRSKSDIARDALRSQITLAMFAEARGRLIPYAETAGYLTDEDVFQNVS